MSKASRDKGKRFEREIAHRFIEAGYTDARRGNQDRSVTDEADVEKTPWWIECKKRARAVQPIAALEQAERDTDGRVPIAVCRIDREPEPTVTMRLSQFLLMVWR